MRGPIQHFLAGLAGIAISLGLSVGANAAIFNADVNNGDLIGLIDAIHLEMVDEVSDGCWTNIAEIRNQTEGLLRTAGIPVQQLTTPDSASHPALVISAQGGRAEGGFCIVQVEASIWFVTASRFATANSQNNVIIVNYNSISNMLRANVAAVSSENVNAEAIAWTGQVINAWATAIEAKHQEPEMITLRTQLGMSN